MKKHTDSDTRLDVAVALHWDRQNAPRVTAKGHGDVAERIIELAKQHDVPLQENKDLVEVLARLDLDQQIPESLYVAVAEVIAFAYMIRDESIDHRRPTV